MLQLTEKKKIFFGCLLRMQFIVAKEIFLGHYLLFINVNRQSHIYISKDFDDYNLIFHLPFSVGYLLCTTLISPCYYLIKQNKNYNGTHNVNSAHCNFIIELFMTLCKKNYWLWIMFIFLDFAHKTNIWGQYQVYKKKTLLWPRVIQAFIVTGIPQVSLKFGPKEQLAITFLFKLHIV